MNRISNIFQHLTFYSGSRINQVRDTLQIFLRSLPEGTLFNIIGFGKYPEIPPTQMMKFLGTKFEKLFPESKEYNDNSLSIAISHVEKMTANLGGTNLLSPIQAILAEKPKEGIPRQVFLLTDGNHFLRNFSKFFVNFLRIFLHFQLGEVDNTTACVDEVRAHADTTRVFTFGIGAVSFRKFF